jgi:hypothetical protein
MRKSLYQIQKEEKQNGDDIFIGIMSKNFSEANETPSSHCLIILV